MPQLYKSIQFMQKSDNNAVVITDYFSYETISGKQHQLGKQHCARLVKKYISLSKELLNAIALYISERYMFRTIKISNYQDII